MKKTYTRSATQSRPRRPAYQPVMGWLAVLVMAVGAYLVAIWFRQWLLVYWLALGAVTCALYGFDKMQAQGDRSRIAEKTLLVLNLAGGWIGGWIGMYTFRHKTQHTSFLLVQIVSTILHLGIGIYVWFFRF